MHLAKDDCKDKDAFGGVAAAVSHVFSSGRERLEQHGSSAEGSVVTGSGNSVQQKMWDTSKYAEMV